MTETAEWLLEWFKRRDSWPGHSPARPGEANYFEAGWIDSLGVIELIAEVEEHFGISFAAGHFQDRRFTVVDGLGEIIDGLKEGRAGDDD